jgi:hypothetical protein
MADLRTLASECGRGPRRGWETEGARSGPRGLRPSASGPARRAVVKSGGPPTSDPEQDGSSQLDLRGPAVESLGVQRGTALPRWTPKAQVLPTARGKRALRPKHRGRRADQGDVETWVTDAGV